MAGAIWYYYLEDNVTIEIHVKINVVAEALANIEGNINYDRLRDNLLQKMTLPDDILAFDNLLFDGKIFELVIDGNKL